MSPAPDSVAGLMQRIRRLRSRWRFLVLAEGLGLALVAVLGIFLGAIALDNWLHLPWGIRLTLLILFLGGTAWVFLVRVILPLRRPYTDEAVAVHLEGQLGDKHNRIINSVQLGRAATGTGSEMIDRALAENTAELKKGPPLERALPVRQAARWFAALVGVALVMFLYSRLFPAHFHNATARLIHPLSNIKPITDTTLDVMPGSMDVPVGGVADIQMLTGGKKPERVTIEYRRGSGDWEKIDLTPYAPNKYSHAFLDVRQSILFTVRAGDARSERFHIRAIEGPDVAAFQIAIHYPDYLGLPDKQENEGRGDVLAPLGSRVTVTIHPNRALKQAEIALPGAKPVLMKKLGGESYQWDGVIERSGVYQLALLDLKGYKNTLPIERDFKVFVDRPPTVDLKPREDFVLTPDAPQPVTLSAEDDFGVREARLLAWKTEGETPKVVFTQAGNKTLRAVEQPYPLTVASLGAVGETWTLVAEAVDFNPDKDRKPTRSQPVHVRLVATRDQVDSKLAQAAALKRGLAELIQLQQANLDLCKTIAPDFEADSIPKWADATFATLTMKHFENAATNQVTIRVKTGDLAKTVDDGTFNGVRDAIENLAQRDMRLVAENLAQGLTLRDLAERRDRLQAGLQAQPVILASLQALLEQVSNLETEIALQTVVAGLEKILKSEQAIQGRTPPNAPAPDAKGAADLADRQKENTGWLSDLQKRLAETTARMSADRIPAAKVFVDLNTAFLAKNLPPVMQTIEATLRGSQWPQALQAETQAIDSLQSLLSMLRSELAKVADTMAANLREALKQAPRGSDAEQSIYKALKDAESLAKEGSEKKSLSGKQTNVPERPLADEMAARDIAKYLKRLQDAAKEAEQAQRALRKADWNDPDYQKKMAAAYQEHRDPKEVDPSLYHLTPGKDTPRDQDWSAFEKQQGGPKNVLADKTPEDMEDLVGDLIDQQERLREKMITSFMQMNIDVKDTGDVTDMESPVGNYAMRGKTGNKMPASQNIGGRSRSGRQGPTFGEIGVDKAQDRKGRPGEGLNSPDQKGYVQDEKVEGDPGADPTTATGGKHSGQAQREGDLGKPRPGDVGQYHGIASEDVIQEGQGRSDIDVSAEALKRDLANRQEQLVKRAEEATKQFEQLFTPSADWFQGVDLMRQIEEEVRKGPSDRLWQLQDQALEKLKRVHREIAPGGRYDFDVGLSKSNNPLVLNPRQEQFPKRDAEALKRYYLRLAEDQ